MQVEVRRAADRFVTDAGWVRTFHAFSYGAHYDPANTRCGALVACNDEILAPGKGFDDHPHRDVDIVTWVLEGSLTHADSAGHVTTLAAGMAQRLWTADGVRHSERNVAAEPARYVQMWIEPDADAAGPPAYESADFDSVLDAGTWAVVAAGSGVAVTDQAVAPLTLARAYTSFLVARPGGGGELSLPTSALLYLFVACGTVELDGSVLGAGDAAVVRDGDGAASVRARAPSEILLWRMTGVPE